MNGKKSGAAVAALLIAGLTASVAPVAHAQNFGQIFGGNNSRQNDKNNMRNLGEGLGGLAALQLLQGKGTNALILGAGAAYAGKKYEDERKAQAKDSHIAVRYRRVYRYRNGQCVGYDLYNHAGVRVSRYNRVFRNNRWTNRYERA